MLIEHPLGPDPKDLYLGQESRGGGYSGRIGRQERPEEGDRMKGRGAGF